MPAGYEEETRAAPAPPRQTRPPGTIAMRDDFAVAVGRTSGGTIASAATPLPLSGPKYTVEQLRPPDASEQASRN